MSVSVIIPTYNSEKYINSAIKSVLGQTYTDFELIIVDDGSTDNTKDSIDSFDDSRIRYIYQDNSGVAKARNTGLENSKGKYIAFLDADDCWMSEKLDIQIREMEINEDICMLYSAFEMVYEELNYSKIFDYRKYSQKDFVKNLLVDPFKSIPFPSTTLIRKSCLDKAGYFNPDFPTGEDWDLWLRLSTHGKCYYIDKILVKKLTHRSSITNSLDLKEAGKYHFRLLDKFLINNRDYMPLRQKAYSVVYYDLACRYLGRNNHKPSKDVYKNLIKSFIFYPPLYLTRPKLQFLYNILIKPGIRILQN